jgi:hypothetical protein
METRAAYQRGGPISVGQMSAIDRGGFSDNETYLFTGNESVARGLHQRWWEHMLVGQPVFEGLVAGVVSVGGGPVRWARGRVVARGRW